MTMRVRVLMLLILALAPMCLVGCGHYVCGTTFGSSSSCTPSGGGIHQGGGGGGGATAFTYFVGPSGMALVKLDMASPGTLTALTDFAPPDVPFLSGAGGIQAVEGTSDTYLYMAFQNGQLFGFSINGTNGAVTTVSSSGYLVTGGDTLAADPNGRFLFVGDFFGQKVWSLKVNLADGTLTTVGFAATSGVNPGQMSTDGLGKYLYVADGTSASNVAAFSINQTTGELTAVPSSPFALNVAQVMGENSGKYVVGIKGALINGGIDNNVYLFKIGTGGTAGVPTLTHTVATTYPPVNMTLSPNGRFVYTFNADVFQNSQPMEGFTLDTTAGTLTELSGLSPFGSLSPQMGHFEQSGKYMIAVTSFVTTEGDASTAAYSADSTSGGLSGAGAVLGAPLNGIFAVTDAPTN